MTPSRSRIPWRAFFAIVVLAAAVWAVVALQSRGAPVAGQEPLTDISSIDGLREAFVRDSGEARLILLASPT